MDVGAKNDGEGMYLAGVVERPWRHVEALVRAGHGTQPAEFLAAGKATSSLPLVEQRLISVYIAYLVRGACILRLKRNATREDFPGIAQEVRAHVRQHLKIGTTAIENTLAAAYRQSETDGAVTAGEFAVFGSAFVGAYLGELEDDLAALKNGLHGWIPRNRDKLAKLI